MSFERLATAVVTLLLGVPLCYAASPEMRPGKWEVKMHMEMVGMPQQMAMPEMRTTHCLTPEQARDPAKDVMERIKKNQQKGGEKCELTHHETSNHTARWTVECTGQQKVKSNGEVTFDSDVAYHGVIKSEIETPQGTVTMTQKMEAHRIGECSTK